jgi:ATP-binding cassette subfamily F protein uup
LPQQIAKLHGRVGELQQRLDDPQLYARDRAQFGEISHALTAAQLELAAAEEKWLKLEILREEIEGL